jgi:hypothetical protein
MEKALAEHAGELQAGGKERAIAPGLSLKCSPADAEVLVDGVLQGRCVDLEGRILPLSKGMHGVEVKKGGFRPYSAMVEAGKARTLLSTELSPTN